MLLMALTTERDEQCRHSSTAHPLPPLLSTATGERDRSKSDLQCRDAIMKVVVELVEWIMG